LNGHRVWNILFKRNLDNAFDGIDNIIRNLNLCDNFLIFWVWNFDGDDDLNLDFDGVRDLNLDFDGVRDLNRNVNIIRDVNRNVTCYCNRVRTRHRYLNIDVSGSLNGVRNLDFHGIRDVNGNLNRSRRNVHDYLNRVWDIDKHFNCPGNSNGNRDEYFLINVLVHFNVVRNIYTHFDR